MRNFLLRMVQSTALPIYAALARAQLIRVPLVRKIFLVSYKLHKLKLEMGPIDSLKTLVRPDDLVLDVGANIGVFTVRFARWVGPNGRVLAVEPEELNFATLQAEIERAGVSDRSTLIRAVCAEQVGERLLVRNDMHPGDHRLALAGDGTPVRAVSIDALVGEQQGKRVGLIKIDVQGAEMIVLQGALETLRKHGPPLFVEIHEAGLAHFGASPTALVQFLTSLGYTINRLEARGRAVPESEAELAADVKAKGYVDRLFLKV
jgi:FkbM family methyltransferase